MNIPKHYTVGGVSVDVELVDRLGGGKLGECLLASGKVKIAENFMNDNEQYQQSESNKENTFYHELTIAYSTQWQSSSCRGTRNLSALFRACSRRL